MELSHTNYFINSKLLAFWPIKNKQFYFEIENDGSKWLFFILKHFCPVKLFRFLPTVEMTR